MAECAESDCSEPATVRLHVPWAENREVCAAHARVLAQQDGVVADPIAGDDEWP
ncbi:hypothetical protein [Halorussus aquaticus]|uniref:DUF8014 domain-containing protein n=1 Tax=Halorussus aquaticus TaxID=2953748 RepID=A0ABD5PWN1_9EURY|nr:hypothetical protein [Halorussus aquaticus]